MALLLALPGCESIEQFYSTKLPVQTPIDWWHQLQGGMIAEERPPPPRADQPYPSLASVPPPPTVPDTAARQALTARLVNERNLTTRDAAQNPIVGPRQEALPPVPQGPPPAASMARLDAAVADPAAPAPALPAPAPAPAPPMPSPSLAPPALAPSSSAAMTQSAPGDATGRISGQSIGEATVAGPAPIGFVPYLPQEPPALPTIRGVPAAARAPASPRPPPQVDVLFPPDSAVMRPTSAEALRALAARRADGPIAVLGGGDARAAAPTAQEAALPLAWERAQAIVAALKSAGVPESAMRVDAAALARGGVVRLVE